MRRIADMLSASRRSPLTSFERLAWKGLRAARGWTVCQLSAFNSQGSSENDSSHSLSAYCFNG